MSHIELQRELLYCNLCANTKGGKLSQYVAKEATKFASDLGINPELYEEPEITATEIAKLIKVTTKKKERI